MLLSTGELCRGQGNAQKSGGAYLVKGQFEPSLRQALGALGDRLERAGKERVIAAGTLSVPGSGTSTPVQIVAEGGKQLRVDTTAGPAQSIVFDRNSIYKSTGSAGLKGFFPSSTFAMSGIETVNTGNGGLTLQIPLVSMPPGRGGFAPGINLIYNSKQWSVQESLARLGLPICSRSRSCDGTGSSARTSA